MFITSTKERTLLVNPGQKVYRNQVIAETKTSNLALEADKIFTTVSGETLQAIKIQSIDNDGAITKTSRSNVYGFYMVNPLAFKFKFINVLKFEPHQDLAKFNQPFSGIVK